MVCCGSGGVGKTTTAAALALRAAEEHGRRTVVLTIDPARRLAQAMGLDELGNAPRQVDGIKAAGDGELHAMMLDMKRTFDEVVATHTDPRRAEEIFANPFYQAMSSTFAGTQEYMAMEKLSQLRSRPGASWDLIIVDTPPSRSALDFLDAPARLGRFLDGRMLRLLLAPARAGGRSVFSLVTASFGLFSKLMDKILGAQLITDVSGFVGALDSMFGGFRERAEQTYRVLQAPETAFLVVAVPEPDAIREADYFAGRLAQERMPLAGLVLNRVHDVITTNSAGRRRPGPRRRSPIAIPSPRTCCASTPRWSSRLTMSGKWPAGSQRLTRTSRWPPSRRSPSMSMTSTGCARLVRRWRWVADATELADTTR